MERLPVELRILGHTELSVAGERTGSFVLRQPKRLALLAYFALATSDGYRRRDQIVALFWPELDQVHARTQLRKVLHALRSTLGNEAFVARGEEELRLDRSRVWCDAVAFGEAIKAGELVRALELYRGDLLEGLYPGGVGEQFETWLGDQRGSLRQQAARAAWECSAQEDLAGRRGEAVTLARRALALDPDDEEGVRRLIAALDRYGDRAGALHLFRQWQSRLQAEYGADPAPETRKLARKVQAPRIGESLETPNALPSNTGQSPGELAETSLTGEPGGPEGERPGGRRGKRALVGILGAFLGATIALASAYVLRGNGPGATLAVLPLRGLGDSTDVRIGQALAEELTTALAQLPAVSVRLTERPHRGAGDELDTREIGRGLEVPLVLDGSVQHDTARYRVNLRLVRIEDEVTLWARAFDLEPDSLLHGQGWISAFMVQELGSRIPALARAAGGGR
jgi:DNA-binding SARP family transcriptional activator/TolB-like protein